MSLAANENSPDDVPRPLRVLTPPSAMARLWIQSESENWEFELDADNVSIGRISDNRIRLNHPTVSKHHARLTRDDRGWRIEDLGSSNGTYVSDTRIESARLSNTATVRIGPYELTLDESELTDEDADALNKGTMFTSMAAIPEGLLDSLVNEPQFGSFDEPTLAPTKPTFAQRNATTPASEPKMNARETLEERKLRFIRNMGEVVIQVTGLSDVAKSILQQMTAETGADRGFLCLFDENGTYNVVASTGAENDKDVRFSQTVLDRMNRDRAGVLIRQSANNEAGSVAEEASLREMRVQSTLCVPLWTSNRIMGFVSLDLHTGKRSFTRTHLELLVAASHQAAVGLERARLGETADQERQRRDYLCQYLDRKIIQAVLESPPGEDPLMPAEREITILFCDIVSFTKMSEGLPPTELALMVREHLTAMTEILFANNGTVDKYIGDAVMALFGAPLDDPLAPVNAVKAAMAMRQQVMTHTNLKLRFGIATGPAIVGNMGSQQRIEYTALGDTVNVASRLETFARPNEIIIDDTTCRALPEEIQVEEIGSIDVKNRNVAVPTYKIVLPNRF